MYRHATRTDVPIVGSSDGMVAPMYMNFDGLPGWTFQVDEVSAGVYVAVGKNESGPSIRVEGEDLDELLARCRRYAAEDH